MKQNKHKIFLFSIFFICLINITIFSMVPDEQKLVEKDNNISSSLSIELPADQASSLNIEKPVVDVAIPVVLPVNVNVVSEEPIKNIVHPSSIPSISVPEIIMPEEDEFPLKKELLVFRETPTNYYCTNNEYHCKNNEHGIFNNDEYDKYFKNNFNENSHYVQTYKESESSVIPPEGEITKNKDEKKNKKRCIFFCFLNNGLNNVRVAVDGVYHFFKDFKDKLIKPNNEVKNKICDVMHIHMNLIIDNNDKINQKEQDSNNNNENNNNNKDKDQVRDFCYNNAVVILTIAAISLITSVYFLIDKFIFYNKDNDKKTKENNKKDINKK